MGDMENNLKQELQRSNTSRLAVEEQIQEMRQRANTD